MHYKFNWELQEELGQARKKISGLQESLASKEIEIKELRAKENYVAPSAVELTFALIVGMIKGFLISLIIYLAILH